MSPKDTVAFWTWYKTGLANNRRSFRKAAKILGMSPGTLAKMADESDPDWYTLATQKDFELSRKIDDEIMFSLVEDAKEVLKRQRQIISLLYKKAVEAIKANDVEYKLSDLVKLFEYEGRQTGAVKSETGAALADLLKHLSPDTRGRLHNAVRRSRISGISDGDILRIGLEHPSSN